MCPFLLELKVLFQDVTSTLTWDNFSLFSKSKRNNFSQKQTTEPVTASVQPEHLAGSAHWRKWLWLFPTQQATEGTNHKRSGEQETLKHGKPEICVLARLGQKSLWKQLLPGASSIFKLLLCSEQRDHGRTSWDFCFKSYHSEQKLEEDGK